MNKNTYDRAMDSSANSYSRQIKVFAESLIAVLMLLVTMPICLFALFLVRMTSAGPVIYSQKRLGRNGLVFTIYKIRTMYQNSEPNGACWSLPGDQRVTPVGRLLRSAHIDELPQLINVLKGDMSLIGPRPERPAIVNELEKALPRYRRRLEVRPGLTGLAQVLQAPDANLNTVRSKLTYDLHYVDHWSLWLDLRILFATVPHVLGVPEESISRMFRLPQVSSASRVDHAALNESSLLANQVLPPLGEVCNTAG